MNNQIVRNRPARQIGRVWPFLFAMILFVSSIKSQDVSLRNKEENAFEKDTLNPDKSPGGTALQPVLWLKSNVGINTNVEGADVNSWLDQSDNLFDAHADVNSTDNPVYRANGINFNPGIEFDGDFTDFYSDGLHLGSDYIYSTNLGIHVFIVCDPDVDVGTDNHVFDFGLAANGGYGMIYSNDDIGIYPNNAFGGANTEITHSYGDEPALVEGRILFNVGNFFFRNGAQEIGVPISLSQLTAVEVKEINTFQDETAWLGPVTIGRKSASVFLDQNGSRIFDGKISEVIVYDNALLPSEIEGVNSYLALKYGITLNHDYYLSNGTRIKDITNGFVHDIAGIGRDDGAELLQKQSKSVSQDAIFTIGRGEVAATNASNSFSFSLDATSFVWANDNVAANVNWNTANIAVFGSNYARIDRTWRIEKTGSIEGLRFRINVDNPDFDLPPMDPNADGKYYLIFDDDGDYTNGGQAIFPFTDKGGGTWESIVNNPNYNYMTIAIKTIEICDNGIDDDGDSFIDCLDSDCSLLPICEDTDNDGVADMLDEDDDNDGLPDYVEMECSSTDTILDWYNGDAPYFLDGSPGVNENQSFVAENNLNINFVADLSNVGSATNVKWNTGIHLGESLMDIYANFTNETESWSFDLNFGEDIWALSFLMRDIDLAEAVNVIGSYNGHPITPILVTYAPELNSFIESNGSVTAWSVGFDNLPADDPRGMVLFKFDQMVDEITIIRQVEPGFVGNPGNGAIAMLNITGCVFSPLDFDGDGVYNHHDLDSDNDGIYDVIEGGGIDGDNDGVIGIGSITDSNSNGWSSISDPDDGGVLLLDTNTETPSNPDRINLDSDGDGCNDVNEAGYPDSNMDGILGGTPVSTNYQGKVIYTP